MWNARLRLDQSWHKHAGQLARSASNNSCSIAVCTCVSKVGHISPWKSVNTLDGPSMLAGQINNYTSSEQMQIDPIHFLPLNEGWITPPNAFSESPSLTHLAVHVDKKRQQTPAAMRPRPSNAMYITLLLPVRTQEPDRFILFDWIYRKCRMPCLLYLPN